MGDLASPLDKRTRDAIAATKPIPHGMPAAPFAPESLSLWLCRSCAWGHWNAPARASCRTCGAPR